MTIDYDNLISQVMERFPIVHGKLKEDEDRETMEDEKTKYEFNRYINGILMAEGVTVERAKTIEEAMQIAARIASRGPMGELPVLVLTTIDKQN